MVEINDLDDDNYAVFDPIVSDVTSMLNEDDVRSFSEALGPNSSAALMLFENSWATRFRDALVNANAELVLSERIPRAAVEKLMAERVAAEAQTPVGTV
jgi:hypothetical protein